MREIALKIAVFKKYQIAIIDDGLQNKSINYDISIACFNSSKGVGNGFLLPAGPLRENISSLKNYDAIFLNGQKKNKNFISILNKISPRPNFYKLYASKFKKFNRNKIFIFVVLEIQR